MDKNVVKEERLYGQLVRVEWSSQHDAFKAYVVGIVTRYGWVKAFGETPELALQRIELCLADAVFDSR